MTPRAFARLPALLAAISIGVSLLGWSPAGEAADIRLSDMDCAEILDRWARDPASVPQRLVDACKEQLAAAPPPVSAPTLVAMDPCAGPDAASSVLCWGPWASLAPAAGPPTVALAANPPDAFECRFELDEQCRGRLEPLSEPPEPPLGSCPPGTPCGFATVVAGVTSSAPAGDTIFARIDLARDGSQFTIEPEDGRDPIVSVSGMATTITPRLTDDYENLRATGIAGDEQSRIVARIIRGDDGIELAADIWGHGNRQTGAASSGYFAWGIATSQAGLDALGSGNATLSFDGPLSVNNATTASVTVNLGATPGWTGTWTNPAWSFGAGGAVTGADLISVPGQFTANVVAEQSFVQGALLGEQGNRGLAHIIDVTLVDQGRIKDVGLLRETAARPTIGTPTPGP